MEKFESMQAFALSWALVFLFTVFVAAVIWAFWPSNKRGQDEAARSIFRNEDRPASDARGS
ncbi:cbb3-type cytochrome oxidase subunit 3 [Solirhodobacter olei]|uniref:cbb3-type cytochrome oxidase subunit 3 n=1 Tax=Solirhodobacter olei TaxID=2493082 RepID=UPI000FDB58A5|nr:cbb3-type cytochrome c oxidase subunit 3 [Solirhodobacter olei]